MRPEPLVTIVTPSLNSGRFIEQAIHSVLQQDYPRIEYLVVDGGSTDETLSILERKKRNIRFISENDSGIADAINRGFAMTEGSILAWLNADDYYLPGAVAAAVESLQADPDAGAVYAEAHWVDGAGNGLKPYPTVRPYDPAMWSRECSVCQPACFFRRSAYEAVGGLDISLKTVFDYDLWIRMSQSYRFISIPSCAAASRMHVENLSLGRRDLVFQEAIQLLKRHYGYVPLQWIYGSIQYSHDRRDQFFQPLQASLLSFLASLPVGMCHNRRHPLKYFLEFCSKIKMENIALYLHSLLNMHSSRAMGGSPGSPMTGTKVHGQPSREPR
ncbi:MAG TPA: glycosyltransferase family 2 protein [Bryobacteraceae bacterium]|jgi:glycosyltransferase involved in cell wall biosynthesis|nr:glycosyltransferase family 2 protein [Bryobacteraceae bacterium]